MINAALMPDTHTTPPLTRPYLSYVKLMRLIFFKIALSSKPNKFQSWGLTAGTGSNFLLKVVSDNPLIVYPFPSIILFSKLKKYPPALQISIPSTQE